MKNLVLIIAFSVLSCKGHLKNEVEYHDIIIEWSGEIDKPIYKIVICTDCSFYQSVELCKLEVSDKVMKKIGETGFKNYRLTIDEQNREEGIRKLDQIYQILKEDKTSDISLKIIQTFKKRIS